MAFYESSIENIRFSIDDKQFELSRRTDFERNTYIALVRGNRQIGEICIVEEDDNETIANALVGTLSEHLGTGLEDPAFDPVRKAAMLMLSTID